VGSLPPAWGGPAYGGVATLHTTLLEGFLRAECPVEVVGVVPPAPLGRELPTPVFTRSPDELVADFYERLLEQVEPDVVVMHHFAHTIGLTHARLAAAPPAIGVAHSWHNITFRGGDERERAWETTAEALGGLRALVGMSRHCLREGEELGLSYPPLVETIYHPLQRLYSDAELDFHREDEERHGIACLGSLIPRKDPATLVEAAARLPGVDVVLAGHGELEGRLRSLIASLSLADRVSIRHLDDRAVRQLLLRSEVMCLPSRSETFGLAYTEALACGTPVVGFSPTLREIRDEVGVDVGEPLAAGTPEEVAAAIERVRQADWDRAELRRRTVAAFGLRGATERYAELIRRVAEGPAAAGPDVGQGADRPPRLSAPTVVCVLGMSRTGTSLTARILNLAGVYLGPEQELLGGELRQLAGEGDAVLARAREANPEGFWEHYRLMRLNERILRSLGGNWRDPPSLTAGWASSEDLAGEREEARELLDASFAGRSLWGWKDPRNSLTLPFWQQLLPRMRYVICLRNPVDVAASLERRDAMPPEEGVRLWLTYVAAALVNTSGRPRLLVPYESHFEDSDATAARLARFAGCDGALEGPAAERLLADTIDDRLWRNRTPTREAIGADWVSQEAVALHLIVELLAATAARGARRRGDGAGGPDEGAGDRGEEAELNLAADLYAEALLARLARPAPSDVVTDS
jgi:glycosyltransferase involved in cell wall biosynthesis